MKAKEIVPEDNVIRGETLSLQSIENFFRYTINPHLMEVRTEKKTEAMMRERGGLNPQLLIIAVFVLIGAGIAYSMVSGTMQQQDLTNKLIGCETSKAAMAKAVVNIDDSKKAVEQAAATNVPPFAVK